MTSPIRVWLIAPLAALALFNFTLTANAQKAPSSNDQSSAGSDLSPAQRAHAEARQAQFQKDVAALRADTKLTVDQKQTKYTTLFQAMDKDMLALLTSAQRSEVLKQRQINAQFQKDTAALQADTKTSQAQKQTRYKTLAQHRQDALLATLTPTQRARVEKEHQIELAQATELNRLGEELQKSQTPAQKKQITAIGVAARTQMQAVISDKTLSDPAKSARITELRQQAQAKINALLTPAQRAKYARLQQIVTPSTAH